NYPRRPRPGGPQWIGSCKWSTRPRVSTAQTFAAGMGARLKCGRNSGSVSLPSASRRCASSTSPTCGTNTRRTAMARHVEPITAMREFADKHLSECAQELLDWGKSSVLASDGRVRELANLCTYDPGNELRHAERYVELAALRFAASRKEPTND